MKPYLIKITAIIITGFLCFGVTAMAFDANSTGLTNTAAVAGYNTDNNDVVKLVSNVINGVIGLIGFVLMIIVLYGGILWMLAGDNTANVKKGKEFIINGIIGLIIMSAAYSISSYVMNLVIKAQKS
jgi:hypothetical protein